MFRVKNVGYFLQHSYNHSTTLLHVFECVMLAQWPRCPLARSLVDFPKLQTITLDGSLLNVSKLVLLSPLINARKLVLLSSLINARKLVLLSPPLKRQKMSVIAPTLLFFIFLLNITKLVWWSTLYIRKFVLVGRPMLTWQPIFLDPVRHFLAMYLTNLSTLDG